MNPIQSHNVKVYRSEVPPEVHDTRDARRLKEACQQFESILLAQLWKKMKTNAQEFSGGEKARPWKQMEDLSMEMASEELAKSGGAGLWKVLYDQMIVNVAAGMKPNTGESADD
jgi:flagellar protein FlgJ